MKVAPIIFAIHQHNERVRLANAEGRCEESLPLIDHKLVHTGQHYDAAMSDAFFEDLRLPPPDIRLNIGSSSHGVQTAEILKRFEEVLLSHKPDVVVVVGDVNSTLACALATAKISFDSRGRRPLLAHVEAGLRSFDRLMPEEVNRVLTDHMADLLFVTEPSGLENLRAEGIAPDAIYFVGNTMIDSLKSFEDKAEKCRILEDLGLRSQMGSGKTARYGLLTLHRPANVDDPDVFEGILAGLEELGAEFPIIFPAHPRSQRRIAEFGMQARLKANAHGTNVLDPSVNRRNNIVVVEPLGYIEFLCLMMHATIVVTDSGGIQEETTCLGIPCVTVRENTERPVTIERGTNLLAGTSKEGIAAAIRRQRMRKGNGSQPDKWDGHAAKRIVDILISTHRERLGRSLPPLGVGVNL
jgi:UDP-N-acetylglucosamine 2-epimerase (non-hydrolysing)